MTIEGTRRRLTSKALISSKMPMQPASATRQRSCHQFLQQQHHAVLCTMVIAGNEHQFHRKSTPQTNHTGENSQHGIVIGRDRKQTTECRNSSLRRARPTNSTTISNASQNSWRFFSSAIYHLRNPGLRTAVRQEAMGDLTFCITKIRGLIPRFFNFTQIINTAMP